MNHARLSLIWVLVVSFALNVLGAQSNVQATLPAFSPPAQKNIAATADNRDRKIAAAYAPVFYQGIGENPRSDFITNFDFDGDWQGDNNWAHAEDDRFPLKAFVYYSVAETASHFFIHYAVFHPRDYKGGTTKGALLSALIREGAKMGGKYDPTGLAEEAALAHENDMEGCLVVVAKGNKHAEQGKTLYVETLHHNSFSRYAAGVESVAGATVVRLDGERPLLYVEPKGHGVHAFDPVQQAGKRALLTYKFTGTAEDPDNIRDGTVGYDLISLQTMWAKTRSIESNEKNLTYGEFYDYTSIKIEIAQPDGRVTESSFDVGKRGSAFLGGVGGVNMARPPWGWFDINNRAAPLGLWFFDPARVVKEDFALGNSFSTVYVQLPFWAMGMSPKTETVAGPAL